MLVCSFFLNSFFPAPGRFTFFVSPLSLFLYVTDSDGGVSIVERNMSIRNFPAFSDRISQIQLAKDQNLLAVIGMEQDASTLKVFNMEKLDANKNPTEIVTAKVRLDDSLGVPSVMACTPSMSDVAIGFYKGSVLLVHYDNQLRYSQTRLICQHEKDAVTGLEFKREESLYVVTMSGLFEYSIQLTGQNQFRLFGATLAPPPMPEQIDLDPLGADFKCTAATEDGEIIVGTQPAIFFWKDEDKRQCLGFDGQKVLLQWFRGNLVVVTKVGEANELAIYDTRNKLIAFQDNKFGNGKITHVVFEWGSAFVFTDDKKVYELVEKDTQSKLESLFKKNLYPIAITLAQNNQLDPAATASIITRYAEHL